MTKGEPSARIDDEAAHWAVRVDDGPLDPQRQAELDAWLAGDSRRLGAYARARAMLVQAKRAKALGSHFDPDSYHSDKEWTPSAEMAENIAPADTSYRRPTRRRVLLWGASAAAATTVAMVGMSWQAAAHTYRTKKGEVRLVPLDDGSSITLNTASEVQVGYASGQRRAELLTGEALFNITRDAAHPFLVCVEDTRIKAAGTSFTVRQLTGSPIEVIVRQGAVEIMRPTMRNLASERISANMRAIVAPHARILQQPIAPAALDRQLAWREGMLAFEDMPLKDAAAEFARYSDVQLEFADPAIGTETVTGLYAANDPRGFARATALSLGLRTEAVSDGILFRH